MKLFKAVIGLAVLMTLIGVFTLWRRSQDHLSEVRPYALREDEYFFKSPGATYATRVNVIYLRDLRVEQAIPLVKPHFKLPWNWFGQEALNSQGGLVMIRFPQAEDAPPAGCKSVLVVYEQLDRTSDRWARITRGGHLPRQPNMLPTGPEP